MSPVPGFPYIYISYIEFTCCVYRWSLTWVTISKPGEAELTPKWWISMWRPAKQHVLSKRMQLGCICMKSKHFRRFVLILNVFLNQSGGLCVNVTDPQAKGPKGPGCKEMIFVSLTKWEERAQWVCKMFEIVLSDLGSCLKVTGSNWVETAQN